MEVHILLIFCFSIVTNWGAAVLVYLISHQLVQKQQLFGVSFPIWFIQIPLESCKKLSLFLEFLPNYQSRIQLQKGWKVSCWQKSSFLMASVDLSRFIGFGPSTKWRTLRCSYAKVAAAAPSKPTCDDLRGEVFWKSRKDLKNVRYNIAYIWCNVSINWQVYYH